MYRLLILLTVLLLSLAGCSDGGQSLFETAQFEEQQNNQAHARELYQQIIKDFPDSTFAQKAKDRLSKLNVTP